MSHNTRLWPLRVSTRPIILAISSSSMSPSLEENILRVSPSSAGGGNVTIFFRKLDGVPSDFRMPGGTFLGGVEGVVGFSNFLFAMM